MRSSPPQFVCTLAEPFQRGTKRIRTDHAGVGLGLAIVKSITQAHDGNLMLTPLGPQAGSASRCNYPPRHHTWQLDSSEVAVRWASDRECLLSAATRSADVPRPSDPVDRQEVEALVEALFEEARQRGGASVAQGEAQCTRCGG